MTSCITNAKCKQRYNGILTRDRDNFCIKTKPARAYVNRVWFVDCVLTSISTREPEATDHVIINLQSQVLFTENTGQTLILNCCITH